MASVFYEQRSEGVFAGMICDHPFPPHVHSVVEMVCLTCGSLKMSIGDQQCALEPGDIAQSRIGLQRRQTVGDSVLIQQI